MKTLLIVGAVGAGALLLMSRKAGAATPVAQEFNGLPVGAVSGAVVGARSGASHYGGARSALGARAVAQNGNAGAASLINGALASVNAKNAQGAGAIANKYLPGSGPLVQTGVQAFGQVGIIGVGKVATKVSDKAVGAIKKLKFW